MGSTVPKISHSVHTAAKNDENWSLVRTQAISLKERFAADFEKSKNYLKKLEKIYDVKEWSTSGYEIFEQSELEDWAFMWVDELCGCAEPSAQQAVARTFINACTRSNRQDASDLEGAIPLNFVQANVGLIGYVVFTVERFMDESGSACIGVHYGIHKFSWKGQKTFSWPQSFRRVMLNGARYQATDALLDNLNECGTNEENGAAGDVASDFVDILSNLDSYPSASNTTGHGASKGKAITYGDQNTTSSSSQYNATTNSPGGQLSTFSSYQSAPYSSGSTGIVSASAGQHTSYTSHRASGKELEFKGSTNSHNGKQRAITSNPSVNAHDGRQTASRSYQVMRNTKNIDSSKGRPDSGDNDDVELHIALEMKKLYKYCKNNAPKKDIHVDLLNIMVKHLPQYFGSTGSAKSSSHRSAGNASGFTGKSSANSHDVQAEIKRY